MIWNVQSLVLHCVFFWEQRWVTPLAVFHFRQIRDTVNWIFCEQMMVCYISVFRDTFWPNGKLVPHVKVRTDSERSETKERAQQKLLDNIPGNHWNTNATCMYNKRLKCKSSDVFLLFKSDLYYQMH